MKKYTNVEKAFILSKIKGIKWEEISESLRDFWVEWKKNNK
jgi:hypothetical protein